MTDHTHFGEIRRREHYQGLACLAEKQKVPTSHIVTIGNSDKGDADILELLLSDSAVTA